MPDASPACPPGNGGRQLVHQRAQHRHYSRHAPGWQQAGGHRRRYRIQHRPGKLPRRPPDWWPRPRRSGTRTPGQVRHRRRRCHDGRQGSHIGYLLQAAVRSQIRDQRTGGIDHPGSLHLSRPGGIRSCKRLPLLVLLSPVPVLILPGTVTTDHVSGRMGRLHGPPARRSLQTGDPARGNRSSSPKAIGRLPDPGATRRVPVRPSSGRARAPGWGCLDGWPAVAVAVGLRRALLGRDGPQDASAYWTRRLLKRDRRDTAHRA